MVKSRIKKFRIGKTSLWKQHLQKHTSNPEFDYIIYNDEY